MTGLTPGGAVAISRPKDLGNERKEVTAFKVLRKIFSCLPAKPLCCVSESKISSSYSVPG